MEKINLKIGTILPQNIQKGLDLSEYRLSYNLKYSPRNGFGESDRLGDEQYFESPEDIFLKEKNEVYDILETKDGTLILFDKAGRGRVRGIKHAWVMVKEELEEVLGISNPKKENSESLLFKII